MDYSNVPFDEITLRSYGDLSEVSGRELVHKICLSLGLLQPQDKRDAIVDVFQVVLLASKKEEWLSSKDVHEKVIENRSSFNLSLDGTAESNIRRILKELRDYGFLEKVKAKYRFVNFDMPSHIFLKIVDKRVNHLVERNLEYLKQLE
jgi:Fe2+ or Zn2+ uptake regulation protein